MSEEKRNLNLPENEEILELPSEPPITEPPDDDLVHTVSLKGRDRNIPPKDQKLTDDEKGDLAEDLADIDERLDEIKTAVKALNVEKAGLLLHRQKVLQRMEIQIIKEGDEIRNNRPPRGNRGN